MRYAKLIINKIQSIIDKILLHVLYIIGIGITSFVAKIVGKKFLNMYPQKSTWEKSSGSSNFKRMY